MIKNNIKNLLFLFAVVLILAGCGKKYTPEQKAYIAKIEKERAEKNEWFKSSPQSPFNYKEKIPFHKLKYFDVDPAWVFQSKLYEYPVKDSLTIYGTKGEGRPTIKFGYVKFNHNGKEYKLNVYKSQGRNGKYYFSIWFTDKTTNKESYGVGRYIDFEKNPDPNYLYTIDFNLAYNPYCAYSPAYSCAIPSKEDYLNLSVKAGEKKFHD